MEDDRENFNELLDELTNAVENDYSGWEQANDKIEAKLESMRQEIAIGHCIVDVCLKNTGHKDIGLLGIKSVLSNLMLDIEK